MLLRRSFVHIPGIGPVGERKLWSRGIHDWGDLRREAAELFDENRRAAVMRWLDESEQALDARDLKFFSKALPREQLWRLVPGAEERIAYLDIETTGLGYPPKAKSTTVTFYFKGELLQEHDAARKWQLIRRIREEASLLVTYYGEAFDVPFLEREFEMELGLPHLDLCFWLKRLGYRGGLKKVQKAFSSIPERESMDIDGYDAVRLWRMHGRGVEGALETLLTYNAEDTVVLEPLLVEAWNLEVAKHGELGLQALEHRPLPRFKTRVRPEIYGLLRGLE